MHTSSKVKHHIIRIIGLWGCLLSFTAQAQLQVFSCEPEWKALVEELGHPHVNVVSATHAFQDPHYIEARPSLIVKLRDADLLVCTGSDLEIGWLPLLIRKSGNTKVIETELGYFMASEHVARLEVPHTHNRSLGDIHSGGNPHVHLDPRRLLIIARKLANYLSALAPQHQATFQTNLAEFDQHWHAKIKEWEERAQGFKDNNYIVHHRNWSYLFNWLSLQEIADLEPKPGIPPTTGHLQELLSQTDEKHVNAILIANYQNNRPAKWLSQQSQIPLITLPFTVGGDPNVTTLELLFDEIIDQLDQTGTP